MLSTHENEVIMKSPKAPVPASSGRVLLVVAIGILAALLGNACDKNKSQSPQELGHLSPAQEARHGFL